MARIFKNSKIFKLKEVESTNFYANKLPDGTPEGSVVWADFQKNGRGQGANSWESDKDQNLTFSVVLYPIFLKATRQFYLSKIVSLAVADFISLYVPSVTIKWPNDIYVGNKKIAGILIENSIEQDFIKDSIVGIGININQDVFLSDAPNPVSLKQLTGETCDLDEMLDIFMNILEYRYGMLRSADYNTVDENYSDRIFRKEVASEYIADNKKFTGTIERVEETGELVITDASGHIRKFLHKEVEFVL
jgi:BirA family biotin operon repressor/biotin-[acetyl-CoA-carboxylase] ligase